MGTWGYTTWEDDSALSYLGGHIRKLKRDIEKNLKANEAKNNVVMDRPVLAGVAMLRALIRGCDRDRSLAGSKAVSWRDRYLAWLDRPDVQDCFKHPERFRREAVKEFRRLIACSSDDPDTEDLEQAIDEEHERQKAEKRKRRKKAKRR